MHLWLRKHTERVLAAMKPKGLDPQVPIRAAAQLLFIHGSATQGQAPSEPSEVTAEVLMSPTIPKAPAALSMSLLGGRGSGAKTGRLRLTRKAKTAMLATVLGSAVGAALAWLSAAL